MKIFLAKSLSILQKKQLAHVMSEGGEEHRFNEQFHWLTQEFENLDKHKYYYIAESEGIIIGFCRLWPSPHINEWIIDGIDVLSKHRRQGIASSLISNALALSKEKGANSVIAHIKKKNIQSIKLVEKFGFEREKDAYLNSYGHNMKGVGWQFRLVF
jgi:RimJ/RimL family protein N-acetyltransferase